MSGFSRPAKRCFFNDADGRNVVPGASDRIIIRQTSIDLTEAAASRNRGRKRSTISADDTQSTYAPMLMAATITPSWRRTGTEIERNPSSAS